MDSINESICAQNPLSVAEELDKERHGPMEPIRLETISSKFEKEMPLFENEGDVEKTYLMTIKPTSIESERAFSLPEQFVTIPEFG
ncbi:hypothetical protein TNCV_3957901 [Trichonephila clavipes]|nr:hypothetical protein TNCV_3957901 [Trichonephila clavipes]